MNETDFMNKFEVGFDIENFLDTYSVPLCLKTIATTTTSVELPVSL